MGKIFLRLNIYGGQKKVWNFRENFYKLFSLKYNIDAIEYSDLSTHIHIYTYM